MQFVYRHAYDWGAAFARVFFPLFRKRRRIAVDNILKAGITDDPAEALRIAKASWGHLVGHVCEALCVPHVVTKENWREHLDVSGGHPDAVKALVEDVGQPIILVSSHHGVWEAATNILSLSRPMIAIARVMNNRLAAWWMKKHHFRGPVTVIDKNHGITMSVMRQWERENAAMTILMDQHASKGLPLSFLGRPARTISSAARLGIRTGRIIVVGSFVRLGPFKYRLVGGEPLVFRKNDNVAVCAQLLNDRLGEAIRQYPEQYLWVHRRWR